MTIKNNKGQTVIESLVILITVLALISGLLWGAYFYMAIEWCDYWTYRTTICLAKDQTSQHCQNVLDKKLNLFIPKNFYVVKQIWKTPRQAKALVELQMGELKKDVSISLKLPLPSRNSVNRGL